MASNKDKENPSGQGRGPFDDIDPEKRDYDAETEAELQPKQYKPLDPYVSLKPEKQPIDASKADKEIADQQAIGEQKKQETLSKLEKEAAKQSQEWRKKARIEADRNTQAARTKADEQRKPITKKSTFLERVIDFSIKAFRAIYDIAKALYRMVEDFYNNTVYPKIIKPLDNKLYHWLKSRQKEPPKPAEKPQPKPLGKTPFEQKQEAEEKAALDVFPPHRSQTHKYSSSKNAGYTPNQDTSPTKKKLKRK